MRKTVGLVLLVLGFTFGQISVARAIPGLQLDILGGFYVGPPEETIFTADQIFTLYAYLGTGGGAPSVGDTYYLSAAITSSGGPIIPPGIDLGSFLVNFDQTGDAVADTFHDIDVTGDMTYGRPPTGSPDLPGHGIYDTYFIEIPFKFQESNLADSYDTAETTGVGPTDNDINGDMYYQAFNVDLLGFTSGPPEHYYRIHFDLYNTETKCTGPPRNQTCTTQVASNAPFSHDAEDPPPFNDVPEPASVLLMGMGLLGLAAFRKNWSR